MKMYLKRKGNYCKCPICGKQNKVDAIGRLIEYYSKIVFDFKLLFVCYHFIWAHSSGDKINFKFEGE